MTDTELINVVRSEMQAAAEDKTRLLSERQDQIEGRLRRFLESRAIPLGSPSPFSERSSGLGSLVGKSTDVKSFLGGSIRGTAKVAIPGRLVTKTVITSGTDLQPGVQATGIQALPAPTLAVSDLLPSSPLGAGYLQIVRSTARFTPGAKVQLNEGDPKQEQAGAFQTVQLVPETIAAWIPVSKQAAQDIEGLIALVDSELLYAIAVAEEDQVLNGTSTILTPVQGQLTGLNVNAAAITTASTTALDVVADLIGALIAAGVTPTGVIMNPADALGIAKMKDTLGNYVVGSPSAAPGRVLWGVPFATSSKQPAGTVLAGDFQRGARLWYREDASIEISSEHSDYFIKNLLAIRAEERIVLGITQPAYFAKATLPPETLTQSAPATPAKEAKR